MLFGIAAVITAIAALVTALAAAFTWNDSGAPIGPGDEKKEFVGFGSEDAIQVLRKAVPADVAAYCHTQDEPNEQASRASIWCQPPGFRDRDAIYYDLMSDGDSLVREFNYDSAVPDRVPCRGRVLTQKYGRYTSKSGRAGLVSCFIGVGEDEGWVWIDWTEADRWILGRAYMYRNKFADVAAWWELYVAGS